MKEILKTLNTALNKADIKVALLDSEQNQIRILIDADQKTDFIKAIKPLGWKQKKDKSKDLYLYGMDHFLYFMMNDINLTVCCQLACRSTLNGEWVPLDRKINNFALDRLVVEKGIDMKIPCPEDYLCYILAKCVYTNEAFGEYDISRIRACMKVVQEPQLSDKLEGVFFYFTPTMLTMLKEEKYDEIIEALWCYSDY